MASIINNIISYATGSGTSGSASGDAQESAGKSQEIELLGEAEELEPEEYKKIEPLFPHLQKKGDPVARPVLRRLNFENSPLSKYANLGCYAAVVDNAYTLKECDELLRIAERSSADGWPIAQVNVGMNRQVLDTSYRNSDRILYDDHVLADKLLKRIEPLIAKDIAYIDPLDAGTGKGPLGWKGSAAKRRADKFRMTRLNERLRTDFMFERIPDDEEELEYRKHLKRNQLLADEIPLDPRDEVPEPEPELAPTNN
ncbi:hypothetical protein TWF788_005384 [Orbilia oligospora]|uniref:Uncharacterized protein n=1 Tax=Orbilia oligospora TaxID=2813651 RepID=A0A7C8PY91_ORBOL|nr:hypothetical protein TWF788_005384 [Orbilia oligospora]